MRWWDSSVVTHSQIQFSLENTHTLSPNLVITSIYPLLFTFSTFSLFKLFLSLPIAAKLAAPFFMASITPTCSPTSLQLRLAFNGAKSPVALHVRLRNQNPRLRPLRAEQNSKGSEWVGSDYKIDGFSGWSNSSGEEEPDKNKKKESYGGEYRNMVLEILVLVDECCELI